MSFLYPTFLLALIAAIIPVIIHLFNFQKPKKVLFTNVKYLRVVNEITSSRQKLKHLLILISRILFIVFLVLAFAQPFLQGNNAANMRGNPNVYFYLDNSFSMQNEGNGEKALDAGINSILKVADIYSPNTLYNLLTNDFEGKDQYLINKDKFTERLTEINFSSLYKSAATIDTRLKSISQNNSQKNNHYFWISDFQKSTIGELSKIKFDSASQHYFFPVNAEPASNVFVDSLWLTSPVIHLQENNTIEASIKNDGPIAIKNLVVKLYIDEVQSGTSSINIEQSASQIVKFNFNLNTGGSKKCRIQFEDFPVAFDNKYYFVLSVSPPIKILHIHESEGNYVQNVYANPQTFKINSYPSGNLNYSAIASSNLIVLDGLQTIDESLAKALKDYTLGGGNLLLFPSRQPNINSYNDFLTACGYPGISKSITDTSNAKVNYTLLPPDFNNPFFEEVFEITEKSISMPFALPQIAWPNRGQKLLYYKNGEAFLSYFQNGNSRLFIAASPLQDKSTNFMRHATFVPVMYKVAFESAGKDYNLAYNFQTPNISIPIENSNVNDVFTLNAKNFKVIPDQRIVDNQLVFSIPEVNIDPGFFTLARKDSIVKVIALNTGREESMMGKYDANELRNIFSGRKNIHVYNAGTDKSMDDFRSENVGKPLWKYCILISLLFLLVEVLLLRFYR